MKAEWPKRLENISFYISVLFIPYLTYHLFEHLFYNIVS